MIYFVGNDLGQSLNFNFRKLDFQSEYLSIYYDLHLKIELEYVLNQ